MKTIGFARASLIIFLLAIEICDSAGLAKRFEDIDAKEIADTLIAKRLVQFGFVEEPAASGLYRAKISWGKLKDVLAVKESDLFSIPNGPAGEWNQNVYIEGGFAHLSGKFEAGERGPIPASEISVCANLGYARPAFLWVGMAVDRLEDALKFLGATNVTLAPAEVLPADSLGNGVQVIISTLPDGTPIVTTWKRSDEKLLGKAYSRNVTGFYIGEGTNGFKGWNPAAVKRQQTIPITKYRTSIPTAKIVPVNPVAKTETNSPTNSFQHPARP